MKRASLVLFLVLSGCFDFKADLAGCVDAGACTPPRPTLVTGELCSADGWCWGTRLPHNSLNAVVSLDANDAWAFGDSDTVLRSDGTNWVFVGGLSGNHADAIAFGPHDLFVVGDGFHHWNGTDWQTVTGVPSVVRIHGVSADDLWLVPADGTRPLYRWHARQLSQVSLPSGVQVSGVFAVSPNSVWATGAHGFVAHWDGSTWSAEDAGTTADLGPVWASSDDDVWVGGTRVVARRTAAGWQVEATSGDPMYRGIAALSSTEVWFSGWDGQLATWGATGVTWSKLDTASILRGMTKSANGVMVAGSGGYIAERSGTLGWARLDGNDNLNHLYDVHGSSETDVWAVGGKGTILHFDGTAWTSTLSGASEINRVFAPSPLTTWAVDDSGALRRRTGSTWSVAHTVDGPLEGLWASDDETLWAVGKVNGASLALHVVHGVATSMTPSGTGLDAVWGNNDSDVWAAGAGVLVHWDGTHWTDLASPTTDGVGALLVKGNEIWLAAGNNVHHFDGSSWRMAVARNTLLTGLALDGPRVWFSGEYGLLGKLEGETASSQVSGVLMNLGGVWASPSGVVFAGGNEGTLLQRVPK